MIYPKIQHNTETISNHYNELDSIYRDLWGEHLHHGLWKTHKESQKDAVRQLVDYIADKIKIQPGMHICDIGCGYGGTARMLAARGAQVSGITLSEAQYQYAMSNSTRSSKTVYYHEDWLQNRFPDAHFDAAIAIESSEHMIDKKKFFKEAYRVLKKRGCFAIYAWLAKENPAKWQIDYLLEPICREGCLPSIGTVEDYLGWIEGSGFKNIRVEDLTQSVKKTWRICAWRFCKALFLKPSFARSIISLENRAFAMTVIRMIIAYRTKALSYCLLNMDK